MGAAREQPAAPADVQRALLLVGSAAEPRLLSSPGLPGGRAASDKPTRASSCCSCARELLATTRGGAGPGTCPPPRAHLARLCSARRSGSMWRGLYARPCALRAPMSAASLPPSLPPFPFSFPLPPRPLPSLLPCVRHSLSLARPCTRSLHGSGAWPSGWRRAEPTSSYVILL